LSNLDANLREEMRFEIRRLHEAFAITTLYVTHDQAEAMVISDRIAVLERGRVAQVGTADTLFDAPRTRFVAEFIGKTNVVDGTAASADTLERGGMRLRVAGTSLRPGRPATVSIRPHLITLHDPAGSSPGAGGGNRLAGVVRRAAFLGDAVEYEVELQGSDLVLRVAAPVSPRLAPGAAVALGIDPAACVPLADEGPVGLPSP
jgi:iron(III) transport system ATP-binding protein